MAQESEETEETSQETSQEPEVEERSKKEARLIPELVFVVDKFESAVVTLSAKKGDKSIVAHMKRATARDFRIQVSGARERERRTFTDLERALPHSPEMDVLVLMPPCLRP